MIRMLRRRQSTKGRTLRPLVLLLWLLLLRIFRKYNIVINQTKYVDLQSSFRVE